MKREKKAKVDRFINKWMSRKLIVFVIATSLVLFGDLTTSQWVQIATVYMAGQSTIDVIKVLKQSN